MLTGISQTLDLDWKMLPLDHPGILYLPPNLLGFTPKKPNLIHPQAREGNPELENMNHEELVDMVKELLQEKANRPTSTNLSKDIPPAGHVTMNQVICSKQSSYFARFS